MGVANYVQCGYHAEASLVNISGRVYQNNSIHDANELFAPPYGLRCFSATRNTPIAEWISPSRQTITQSTWETLQTISSSNCGFIDLIRNRQINDESGVFTCKISSQNGLQILHIGVYGEYIEHKNFRHEIAWLLPVVLNRRPTLQLSQMEIKSMHGTATTVFNCSSSNSPATNVVWLRENKVIEEDNYHQVNQILRDPVRIVYDNLLMISDMVIESGLYKCVVNDSQMERFSTLQVDVGEYNKVFNLTMVCINVDNF